MPTTQQELMTRKNVVHSADTDITPDSVTQICGALTILLANVFALYIKTKNFHWSRGQHQGVRAGSRGRAVHANVRRTPMPS